MTTKVPGEMLTSALTSAFDGGASADGVTDDSAFLQAFIDAGGGMLPPGVYKFSTQLKNTVGDLVLWGHPGTSMRDWGNSPGTRVLAAGNGAVLYWTGSNAISPIQFDPDVGSRCVLRDFAVHVGNAFQTSIVKIVGSKWFGYTGVTPHVEISGLGLYRDSQATNPADSACSGIQIDLSDAATPRAMFGANISDIFGYGLEQGLYVTITNQTTPASGNWCNGNQFNNWHLYKCYRAAHLIAGTTGEDQLSMNLFANWQVQPVGDGGGVFAPGVLRLVNNVNRNTFLGFQIYDLASAGGARRHIHASPHSTNPTAFNRYFNCVDFEFDGSSPMSVQVDPDEANGSATYDPANLADGAGVTTTVAAAGAALGDYAVASFSLDLQGVLLTSWVSAADTVSVRFQNETGGPIDLGSGTIRVRVKKI